MKRNTSKASSSKLVTAPCSCLLVVVVVVVVVVFGGETLLQFTHACSNILTDKSAKEINAVQQFASVY